MKKLMLVLMLVFLVACSEDQASMLNPVAQIQEIETRHYDFIHDGLAYVNMERFEKEIQRFDPQGRLVVQEEYDIHGNLRLSNTYDYSGDLLMERRIHNHLTDHQTRLLYTYEDQNVIKLETFLEDQLHEYQVTEYRTDSEETTVYNALDEMIRTEITDHLDHGYKISRQVIYDRSGNEIMGIEVSYNAFDQPYEQVVRQGDKVTTYKSFYDDQGNMIEMAVYENEISLDHVYLTYDAYNNLISMTDAISSEVLEYCEYVYDDHGNYLEKACYTNDELKGLIERTITYYTSEDPEN